MAEYVKWCSSREDFAEGSFSRVVLRTPRYSEKRLSRIPCFFDVSSRLLSTIHFIKVLPVSLLVGVAYILHPSGVKVLLKGRKPSGGVRFLLGINSEVSATPTPRRTR